MATPRKKSRSQPGAGQASAAMSAESAYAVGLQALRTGEARELESAADLLRAALEAAPGNARLARVLGNVLEAAGEPEQALAVLERAFKRSSGDADLLVELGYARLTMGETDAARKAFERALPLRPRDALIRQPLARIYELRGNTARAAETLAGIPQESFPPRLLGDLARLYLGLGRHREAEGVFRSLAAADPEHTLLAWHGTTWCLIKQGNWRGALEAALQATRLDRFDLTTALLAYAKDRLFTRVPDAAQREAELSERFLAELKEHEQLHAEDEAPVAGAAGAARA
jgi:tetratricopeptide (TPR) repeat protein